MVLDFAPKLVENFHIHIGQITIDGKKEPWRVFGIIFAVLAIIIVFSANYWKAYLPQIGFDFLQWFGPVLLIIGFGLAAIGRKGD